MGIGGGFILIPIMIYLLRVPTSTVIGTSMVLTLVTMVIATMLHAVTNHLVDAVLALILMVGGVTGAQFGARAGQKHPRRTSAPAARTADSGGRDSLCDRTGDPARRTLHHPRNRRRRMTARASFAAAGLALLLSAALPCRRRARRAADRLGLEPPRHRDAELFRRGTGAVRLGRKGRQHAGQPHQLRYGRDRQRSARRHGDAAQGAQIRHLDQHRLPAIPRRCRPISRCSPTGRSRTSPRRRCSGASNSASTMCC